ncbi:MAG: type II secretion system minor pseudopilin GspK [Candidatus Contendobacter sp.]
MKLPACCPCPADAVPIPLCQRDRASRAKFQAGVALITVLLIVFLASIAAISLASLQQLAIRRSTVLLHQQQARLYALGAEQWAMVILARDRQRSETDHPGEEWAKLPPALPIEDGTLTARLVDQQSCFNLNNLWRPAPGGQSPSPNAPREDKEKQKPQDPEADTEPKPDPTRPKPPKPPKPDETMGKAALEPAQIKVLQRLLENFELKPALAQAIADWIDPDPDPQFPDGAEDSDYMVLNPAYLAANRPFLSVSELRLVKGVDREAYDKLAPVICALPPGTPLNVNTALAPILAALGEGLKPADLERLLEDRPAEGYKNVDDFLNAAKLTTVEAPVKALLSTDSQYFLLRAEARVGDGRAMLYSMFYRDENGVRVLRRDFGHQD